MHLLKKGILFNWDEAAQCSFGVFKCTLTSAPLLQPSNYSKYFLLYLVIAESTIDMVLVQEYDFLSEYMIYYLSRGLVGLELNYSQVEKLVLAAVHPI
jgi:hypothetical protein